jgi:Imm-5 like putative immunity protein
MPASSAALTRPQLPASRFARHGGTSGGAAGKIWVVGSPQTLSEADRRIVATWAAECAERVLGLFEAEAPGDIRPRDAIARTRAFACGELDVAGEIRRRFVAGGAARGVTGPAPVAAARAAGQAAAVAHMGAHALGAAAYADKAAGLAAPDRPEAVSEEIRWQLAAFSALGNG